VPAPVPVTVDNSFSSKFNYFNLFNTGLPRRDDVESSCSESESSVDTEYSNYCQECSPVEEPEDDSWIDSTTVGIIYLYSHTLMAIFSSDCPHLSLLWHSARWTPTDWEFSFQLTDVRVALIVGKKCQQRKLYN
jgi:hypothetical protein